MQQSLRLPGIALAILCAGLPAWGNRPLVSETADALPRGDCELETAAARTRARRQPGIDDLQVSLGCGMGHDTQLGLAHGRSRSAGQTNQALRLGGKTSLVEVQDGRIGWAIAYGLTVGKGAGGGWKQDGSQVQAVASRALGPQLLGHLNLGWQRDARARRSSTAWSLGVEGTGPLHWTADLFGDDRQRPGASVGLLWPLAESLSANLAYAHQFDRPKLRQWSVGFQLDF